MLKRLAVSLLMLFALVVAPLPAFARSGSLSDTYSSDEMVRKGSSFFGSVAQGMASVVEKAVSQYGLPNGYILGQTGGAETVTLNSNQIPVHTHQPVAAAVATAQSPGSNFWASYANDSYSSQAPDTPMAANALSLSGGNQPHENMPPYQVLNFILATEGIYPPPN